MIRIMLNRLILFSLLIAAAVPASLQAQALDDELRKLGIDELVRGYIRPAADAIGYGLNSGLFHNAEVKEEFHIWVGIKGVWTIVPASDKTFTAIVPPHVTALGYPDRVETATIFGEQGAVLHSNQKDPNGNPYPSVALPNGTGLNATLLVLPHVEVGALLNTEFMLRGIPPVTFDPELGKVTFIGLGLKHALSQTLGLPLPISVMVSWQDFRIGSALTVQGLCANVHTSAPILFFTGFAGVGYESYSVNTDYLYTPPQENLPSELANPHRIALSFEGRNLRFTFGLTLSIAIIDLTGSYSFGFQDNFTVGAGLSF